MSITIEPTAPPGQPNDADAAVAGISERLYALEETARRVVADKAAVARDRDRLLGVNFEIDRENRALRGANEALRAERDELLAEVQRYRRAALAQAAFEDAELARRPLTGREQALSTLIVLGGVGVLSGALTSEVALFIGGFILAGLSGAVFLLCRNANDPNHPFDLDDEAADREN